jgi:hypothetical protein
MTRGRRRFAAWSVLCAALIVLVFSFSCTKRRNQAELGRSAEPTTPSAVETLPTPTTKKGIPESYLRRHEAPPAGVAQQITFFGEGDGQCSGLNDVEPAIEPYGPEPAIATQTLICFAGFATNTPVDADLQRPDGSVTAEHVDTFGSDGVPYIDWVLIPGDQVGTYRITGRQDRPEGGLEVTQTFDVELPPDPRLLVLQPDFGPPGTTFRIGMAGFSPNRSIALYLYAAGNKDAYQFIATLPPARMDGEGKTIYALVSQPGDPTGTYCVARKTGDGLPRYCGAAITVTE